VFTLKELPSETRPLLLKELFEIGTNFHVVTELEGHRQRAGRGRESLAPTASPQHQDQLSFEPGGEEEPWATRRAGG